MSGPQNYGPSGYQPGGPPPARYPQQPGFPPVVGGPRRRSVLFSVFTVTLVVLLVAGGFLAYWGGRAPGPAGSAATGTTASTAPRSPTVPPLPSALAPTPRPTPSSTSAPTPAGASPADIEAITALGRQLITSLNSADQAALKAISCGTFLSSVNPALRPQSPPLVYDSTRDIVVVGDRGTASLYASKQGGRAVAETISLQRSAAGWQVCQLGTR